MVNGGLFHPKIVFLRAGKNIRICFGSANITSGGFGRNLELWAFTDDIEVGGAIAHFLKAITDQKNTILLDPPSKRAIHRALAGIPTGPSPTVWSSLEGPFSRFVQSVGSGLAKAKKVYIISPGYATKEGVAAALKPFPKLKTTVYTDAFLTCKDIRVKYFNPPYLADGSQEEEDTLSRPSALHAKAFLFENTNESVMWFGSANLTAKALVRPLKKGGNVEILVKTMLKPNDSKEYLRDLDQFFPLDGNKKNAPLPNQYRVNIKGFVLSGEFQIYDGKVRLIIYTVPSVKSVVLKIGGQNITLLIKNDRGIIENIGQNLPELIDGSNGDNWTALIYEIIGRNLIP